MHHIRSEMLDMTVYIRSIFHISCQYVLGMFPFKSNYLCTRIKKYIADFLLLHTPYNIILLLALPWCALPMLLREGVFNIFQQQNVNPYEIYNNCIQLNIVFHTIILFRKLENSISASDFGDFMHN